MRHRVAVAAGRTVHDRHRCTGSLHVTEGRLHCVAVGRRALNHDNPNARIRSRARDSVRHPHIEQVAVDDEGYAQSTLRKLLL